MRWRLILLETAGNTLLHWDSPPRSGITNHSCPLRIDGSMQESLLLYSRLLACLALIGPEGERGDGTKGASVVPALGLSLRLASMVEGGGATSSG